MSGGVRDKFRGTVPRVELVAATAVQHPHERSCEERIANDGGSEGTSNVILPKSSRYDSNHPLFIRRHLR